MFILYIFEIFFAFIFAYYTFYRYVGLPTSGELSDYVTSFIANFDNFLFTFLYLLIIFLLLEFPTKTMIRVLTRKKMRIKGWERWKGVILFLLIFDVYFYMFMRFEWILLVPLVFFLFLKLTLFTK